MKNKTLLTEDQVTGWIRDNFPTARKLADAAGITTAGAYRILAGAVTPTAATLEKIGVKIVYQVGV